jgi:hypothetical protein
VLLIQAFAVLLCNAQSFSNALAELRLSTAAADGRMRRAHANSLILAYFSIIRIWHEA